VGRQLAQTQYFQTAAQLVNRFTISAECFDLNPKGRVIQRTNFHFCDFWFIKIYILQQNFDFYFYAIVYF